MEGDVGNRNGRDSVGEARLMTNIGEVPNVNNPIGTADENNTWTGRTPNATTVLVAYHVAEMKTG